MKRNYSLQKMNMIQISNRLNRLKEKDKPRLQFPTKIQSKKHYFQYQADQLVLGNDFQQSPPSNKNRRNNLDISDIEGTRPKIIEKQKNVLSYYKNINEQYSPFVSMQAKILRALSQPKLIKNPSKRLQTDSLDLFQKQMEKKIIPNPQSKLPALKNFSSKRQVTQPVMGSAETEILTKKLNLENKTRNTIGQKVGYQTKNSVLQQKSSIFNPTFLSNLVLL